MADPILSPGAWISPALTWLNVNHHDTFARIAAVFEALLGGVVQALSVLPPLATLGWLAALAFFAAGWRVALLWAAGLGFCLAAGMWTATLATIALVLVAVVFSVAIGIPLGVFFSRTRALKTTIAPVLDLMQTMPPWVYLVPFVILFGLGAVPALLATVIYGIAPMMRLTLLAMALIPQERIELGQAVGATRGEILRKIELPSALPTLLVGVNQCILLSLAMVVLAGLVGAGGLGAEVTKGLTRMDFGLGLRASLAIVALAVMFDRACRGAVPRIYTDAAAF